MTPQNEKSLAKSSDSDVDAFLKKVASMPVAAKSGEKGRLIFAMDATASREPAWDRACHIQSEMFTETAALGGLDIQLVFYRGFREFYKSKWISEASALLAYMSKVRCVGGMTQIERVLKHTVRETETTKVNAVVFVGDCVEEDIDRLSHQAGELGLRGVPVFIFHEGNEPIAGRAFREIARLSRGAYCRFDATSAQQLADLLSAVAVYAAGGRRALENFSARKKGLVGDLTKQLTHKN